MARPSKFTPEITAAILKAIGLGASYRVACEAAGVDYATFANWQRQAEEGNRKFLTFFDDIRTEKAAAITRHLTVINNAAAKGDWKASERWLRANVKDDWGERLDLTSGGEILKVMFVDDEPTDKTASETQHTD